MEPAAAADAQLGIASVSVIAANAKLLELAEGFYALNIGATRSSRSQLAGTTLPVTQLAHLGVGADGVEVLAASGARAGWLGPDGGTAVVRAPPEGGFLLITTYRQSDQDAEPLEIQITRLDRAALNGSGSDVPRSPAPAPQQATAAARDRQRRPPNRLSSRDLEAEIVLHIERKGDCHFTAGEWMGERGKKLRIEAFSLRPLEGLSPVDIEYKAFGPNGRETPWVTDARLCGSRGRGMPLTGFAVRLAPHLDGRYEVVYEGAFFDSGVVGPRRNGEACSAPRLDDPLEALNIRLIERSAS